MTILNLRLIRWSEEEWSEACVGQICQITITGRGCQSLHHRGRTHSAAKKRKNTHISLAAYIKYEEIGILKSCWNNALVFITGSLSKHYRSAKSYGNSSVVKDTK